MPQGTLTKQYDLSLRKIDTMKHGVVDCHHENRLRETRPSTEDFFEYNELNVYTFSCIIHVCYVRGVLGFAPRVTRRAIHIRRQLQ